MKLATKAARVLWLTFCEADERYIDLFRVGYALVLITGVGLAIYSVLNGEGFDATSFGTGLGAILFGGGAGIGLRARWEDGTGTGDCGPLGYEENKSPEYRTNSPFNKNKPPPENNDFPGGYGGFPGNPWFDNMSGPGDNNNLPPDDLPASRHTE